MSGEVLGVLVVWSGVVALAWWLFLGAEWFVRWRRR